MRTNLKGLPGQLVYFHYFAKWSQGGKGETVLHFETVNLNSLNVTRQTKKIVQFWK